MFLEFFFRPLVHYFDDNDDDDTKMPLLWIMESVILNPNSPTHMQLYCCFRNFFF